ncbi:MAG: hypothetical protein QOK36_670 [Gaiellales bacterium]|nr:hypothetical protein [Gaiellales bacterium]
MARSALSIYLEDHLAGSTAGVGLARRVVRHTDGGRAGQVLSQVARDIEADRDALKRLMSALGIRGSLLKNATALTLERASRLKPNGRLRGETRMQRLHELESLSIGIAGKQAMWVALRVVPEVAACAEIDLDELDGRAREQRERVEIERIAVARDAFAPVSNVVRLPEHVERDAHNAR